MEMLKLESIDLDDIFQGVDSLKAEPLQLPPIDENDAEFLFNLEDGLFSWPLTTLDQEDDDENLLSKQFRTTTGSISPKAVVDGVLPVTDHQNGDWNETVATAKAHANVNSNSSDGSEGHSESAVVVTVQKPGTTNRPRTAAEKKQKIREKNRRAQNKYREKLKTQRQETEVHLEMAIADVERLRLENARLSSQVDVMERILEVRESAVRLLEAGKATQGSTSSKDLGGLLKRLGPSGPRPSAFTSPPKSEMVVQLNESSEKCPLTNLTFQEVAAIKASGHDYLKRRYAELAERLRDVLEQVDDRRCSQTSKDMSLEAMKGILWECGCLCFEHAVANPTGMQKLLAASIQDGQDGFDNEDSSLLITKSSEEKSEEKARHWATVADQLELTEQQLRQLEPHKNLFQRRIHRITERKRAAVQALNSSDVNDQMTITMSETTSRWLQVQAASQELTAIIQEEYIACMEFVAKSFGDVFSPLQKARAIVSSYPDFPDAYSIATAACKALEKRLE
jgi:hypothetical protein